LDYVEGGPLNRRREEISRELDSTDANLRPFAARGGKLIVTIGTNDTLASPGAQLDYYQSVIDTMGRDAVDAFARLFVIPQGSHGLTGSVYTTTGDGRTVEATPLATSYERFAYLVDWVERGVAPAKTLEVSGTGRTMPLCSYPTYPQYVSGPATSAASYRCAQ
jgi:feruloyl esterase